MTWKRLAHQSISSTGDNFSNFTFDEADILKVVIFIVKEGTGDFTLFPNNVTSGSNFSANYTKNGGSYSGNNNHCGIHGNYGQLAGNTLATYHITNLTSSEKLVQWNYCIDSGTGINDIPDRFEAVGKYTDTSNKITSFSATCGGGGFGAGSYITVWGDASDVTTDEKTTLSDIPANTRYEETDTRKIYRWKQAPLEPVFHYKFSESSGDVINHGSIANADLTVGSLTRDQSTPSGIGNGMKTPNEDSGYAENTSRVNDYKFMHDGTAKWSITFWLKCYGVPDTSTTEHMLFGNVWTDDAGIGFGIRLAKNSDNSSSKARIQTMVARNAGGMPVNDQTADDMMPDTSNWHFYCITYDPTLSSNNLTISRDAETSGTGFSQDDTTNENWSTANPTRKTTYMARPTEGSNAYDNGVEGTMAQIMIFKDVILSQANKESLYASGYGTTTIPDSKEWVERGTA